MALPGSPWTSFGQVAYKDTKSRRMTHTLRITSVTIFQPSVGRGVDLSLHARISTAALLSSFLALFGQKQDCSQLPPAPPWSRKAVGFPWPSPRAVNLPWFHCKPPITGKGVKPARSLHAGRRDGAESALPALENRSAPPAAGATPRPTSPPRSWKHGTAPSPRRTRRATLMRQGKGRQVSPREGAAAFPYELSWTEIRAHAPHSLTTNVQ